MPKGMGYGKRSAPRKMGGGGGRKSQSGIGKSNRKRMGRTGTKSK